MCLEESPGEELGPVSFILSLLQLKQVYCHQEHVKDNFYKIIISKIIGILQS